MIKNYKNTNNAFTLIELLVVIAIIGILSSVVITSLNSAREKSKIALIKSTLKQLYNQAEINFISLGSYSGSNPSHYDTTCAGIDNSLGKIAQQLIDQNIIVKCSSAASLFAATAIIYDDTMLKAWSVDQNGVVEWDKKGVTSLGVTSESGDVSMNWSYAMSACTISGGRLPSVGMLLTLMKAYYEASGNISHTPVGFTSPRYWTSTENVDDASSAWRSFFDTGVITYNSKSAYNFYVRCVR